MSDVKHTAGPWFDWDSRKWLVEPNKLLTNYEDACLIAAAPEMLEALKIMTGLVRLRYGNLDPDIDAEVQKSFAIIAAASGETP